MIWILLLCHFVADYPLQTNEIVEAKKQVLGLTAHVVIHFITLLIIMVGILEMDLVQVLPAILALTGFHFAIDTWKNILSTRKPGWVIFAYLQDQVLHLLSIILVTYWLESGAEKMIGIPPDSLWIIIPLLSLLLATYVWFITERILFYKSLEYLQWVNTQFWLRMIGRSLMLSAWFIGWNGWALLVFSLGLFYHWLDLKGSFHFRALLIDTAVVSTTALSIHLLS